MVSTFDAALLFQALALSPSRNEPRTLKLITRIGYPPNRKLLARDPLD
jgi:hypothetical protein